jgi:branched-subunit amino acid ABC-type transport system permease component
MITQIFANGVVAGCTYALVAIGFGLIFRVCGFFHLAHGAVYTVAAYSAYLFTRVLGWSPWLSLPVAVIAAAALGVAIQAVIYKPMKRLGATPLTLLIASLGLMVAIQNAVSLIAGDDTKRLRSADVREGFAILGAHVTAIQLIVIGASILLSVLVVAWVHLSRFGKIMRAVACDSGLSRVVGISTFQVNLIAFGVGSALAATAAVLLSYDTDLTPAMGFKAVLMAVVAVIAGGTGSVSGSLWGGLLVGIVQHFGVWRLPTQWQDAIVFGVLILFLILRREGVLGGPLAKRSYQ